MRFQQNLCMQVKQKAAERDWTREQQALGKAQKAALGCAHPAASCSLCVTKGGACSAGTDPAACSFARLDASQHRRQPACPTPAASVCCRAAERVGSAATAGGNWVWNASSKATNALKGDAITVCFQLPPN